MVIDGERFRRFREQARDALLRERVPGGHWEGELSTSALSTATSIVALHCVDAATHRETIRRGADWLERHQNADGGWGDTVRSFSNISTTLLCWSALRLCREGGNPATARAESWVRDYVGSLSPEAIAETVKARYGRDRTFSVPILMLCAIGGTLGTRGWRQVLPLPYELAAFPRKWFAAMRLPVVSYALPALIAIGRARFEQEPPWPISPAYWLRRLTWPRVSRLLREIQPASGGYLEAAPLTGFVTMALASAGRADHPAAVAGIRFLVENVRPDGSWPIDTNLATWATTLAVKALHAGDGLARREGERPDRVWSSAREGTVVEQANDFDRETVRRWLLEQQYGEVHPFTNSAPGAWAWTDLSGGVPDADDTPGALLALACLKNEATAASCREAAERGIGWLLDLQNDDGGIPTFCRGWGALPFDRSAPDLTAHTLRAWSVWRAEMPAELQEQMARGTQAALRFLRQIQTPAGAWIPLWFGNQHRNRDEENLTYGTAVVCRALEEIPEAATMWQQGIAWLSANQNPDGGWGGGGRTPSSIEETGLSVSALARADASAAERGVSWLEQATRGGTEFPEAPIGFYFAKLWYFERIYPRVWTVEALERVAAVRSASSV